MAVTLTDSSDKHLLQLMRGLRPVRTLSACCHSIELQTAGEGFQCMKGQAALSGVWFYDWRWWWGSADGSWGGWVESCLAVVSEKASSSGMKTSVGLPVAGFNAAERGRGERDLHNGTHVYRHTCADVYTHAYTDLQKPASAHTSVSGYIDAHSFSLCFFPPHEAGASPSDNRLVFLTQVRTLHLFPKAFISSTSVTTNMFFLLYLSQLGNDHKIRCPFRDAKANCSH